MAACLSGWRCAGIASKALALIKFLISTCFASFIFCFSSGSRDLSLTSIALLRSCEVKNDPKFPLNCFQPRLVSGMPIATSIAAVSCVQNDCAYSSWKLCDIVSHGPCFSFIIPPLIPPLGARCCPRRGRTFWKCFLSPNTFEGSHGFFIYLSFILHVIVYFISHIIILSNPYICHPLNVRKSKADGGDWPTPPGIHSSLTDAFRNCSGTALINREPQINHTTDLGP